MGKILKVDIGKESKEAYNIVIEADFGKLSSLISDVFSTCKKLMLVFDSNTDKYYKEIVSKILLNTNKDILNFTFNAGEDSKNLNTVYKLYEELIINKFERNDVILAVGGGVVGDLAGFCAATFLRGIRFAQIPTTLLAMTDSSVGGKTGVDLMAYKNMVGAFHQPKLVYMNTATLDTLPEREFLSGMAEVIKYGYISDGGFLKYLEENVDGILARNESDLQHIIYTSCRIKKEVVEKDPMEEGIRAILNYGHTVGHAIEKLMNFTLLHGECVALGMVAAAKIAHHRNLISTSQLDEMKELLIKFKLYKSISISNLNFSREDVLLATKSDKKMQGGIIKFILTKRVGEADIYRDISDEELMIGINEVFED